MWRKTAENLMMLLLCFCFIFLFKTYTVNAARMETAEEYEPGDTYQGRLSFYEEVRYFRFLIPEKSHVTMYLERSGNGCVGAVYNAAGDEVMKGEDFTFRRNLFSGWSSTQLSRTLSAGTYYLELRNEGNWKWQEYKFSFQIQVEKQIKLEKGVLRSLESPVEGQLTVICEPAEYAIGYRIQYAMDEQMKKGVETVDSPTRVKTIKKLKKGKRYYVKVCPYTIYDDGTYVYGENSYVKTIVIRKADNTASFR